MGDFESPADTVDVVQGEAGGSWSYAGRNLHYGVREHAMGAIMNGLAAHGGARPFGASAPGQKVQQEYGLTVDHICARARALLKKIKDRQRMRIASAA